MRTLSLSVASLLRVYGIGAAIVTATALVFATSTSIAATTYTWSPVALVAGNWTDTAATGWNSGGGYPGSGGDLTLGAVENDFANMNSQAYTGNAAIHMNGVNAFISELDIGSTSTSAGNWTIDGLGTPAGGSLTFKALSGTAVLNSTMSRNNRTQTIKVPVAFASNTNVTITPSVGLTDYIEIPGTVSGAGNLTINTPGTSGGGVFALEGDVSGYSGTISFDSTGTVTNGGDRVGLISSLVTSGAVNAHQMSVNLSGDTTLGRVGISTIELGALNGTGGYIHPYVDGIGAQTLKVGYKNNLTDTFNGVLAGSVANNFMSFEKAGTGIQILGGTNTYSGTTTVSGGTLKINSTGSINNTSSIAVQTGATFDVSAFGGSYSLPSTATLKGAGTVSGGIVTSGNTIAPGDSAGAAGTLTINGPLSLNTNALSFDLSNSSTIGNDKIAGVGNLSLSGVTTFNFTALNGVGSGHYHLIDYSGLLTGDVSNLSFTGLSAGSRQSVSLSTTQVAHAVTLEVTGTAGNLTWKGNNGSSWDVNTTINWTGATDNHFFNGDNVTFNDTATTFGPTLSGDVQPLNMTFANTTAHAYSIGGSGAISVGANLTQTGNGSVTIANSGDFGVTGNLVQSAGTLTISNTGTFNGFGGGTTLNGILNLNVGGNSTIGSAVSGTGTFNKQGVNIVTLSGDNSGFTGAMSVAAGGTLKAGSHTAFGALGSTVTVANGATLDLNGYDLTKATVTAEGTGVGGTAGGLAASVAAAPGGSGAQHVYGLTLSNDLTIKTGATIMAIDNFNGFSPPGAFLHGNGKNLNIVTGGEVDLIGLGDTNLNNVTVSGGGTLFLENNVSLGATGSLVLLDRGRVGLYQISPALAKPINVDSAATVAEVSSYASDNTIASPINVPGASTILQANARPVVDGTTTLTLAGPITGNGNLELHDVSNSITRNGVVALTSDGNTYAGTTLIGGGSAGGGTGIYNITPAGDGITLSVGDGGSTGSLGMGDVTVSAAATLRFNRSAPITVANNILGGGAVTVTHATGKVTLTSPSNSYSGNTTVSGGTLLVNGSNNGGGAYSVAIGGTLGGTGSVTASTVTVDAGGALAPGDGGIESLDVIGNATINGSLKIEYQGSMIDQLNVNGTLDITNATLDLNSLGTPTIGTYVFAMYSALSGTQFASVQGLAAGSSIDYSTFGSIALVVSSVGVPGDYNNNGVVDAADYVVWRKHLGQTFQLPNEVSGTTPGQVTSEDYNAWRARFGATSGSGSSLGGTPSVPEPSTLGLLLTLVFGIAGGRRRRNQKQ